MGPHRATNGDRPTTKPALTQSVSPIAALFRQTIAFVRDFAAFAGLSGVIAAALAVLAAIFEGVGLLLLVPLLSIVTVSDGGSGWTHRLLAQAFAIANAQTRAARLGLLLGVFAVLVVMRAIIVARRNIKLAQIQTWFIEAVRARLAGRLAAAPWPVVSRLQHARVTHLMSGDIARVGAATHHLVQFSASIVVIGAQVVIAFLLAPVLTTVALFLIGIGAAVGFAMLRQAHDFGTQVSRMGIALMHETSQFLGGLKLAAGQNRQANFVDEFQASLAAITREQLAYIRRDNRNRLAATIIAGLLGALIAFVGLVLFDIQPAVILTILLIFARISGPAMQMSDTLQEFAGTVPAHAELLALERDLAAENVDTAAPAIRLTPGPIVFRDVSFHHDRSRRAGAGIERLDLTIAPGTFLGVSGPTGAGKTTFADLLIGLIEPDSGEIAVAGTPIRGAAAITWREHVSYVVQDPYLFRDTIRRNLLWANPQASESEIWDALATAGVDGFVAGLPAGLDTVLGERGTLISGGERQRLCLARAMLRRPFLFVLDEATSAIDVAAERKIIKAVLAIKPRPTIVMIAHRDVSLADCDRLLRLENGRAVTEAPALTS
ncbi:MAG: ABC transporter ATP-binding protein [Xanthobacteraceae bacterium]